MVHIQVGNAPCSWGTLEFEGLDANPIGYKQMLDELVETGYTATELGDWGFMPTEPEALRKEIESRNLVMLGAYIHVAFKYPASVASRRKRLVVLQDDTVFQFPVGINLTSYKPEHKVRITYETTKSGLKRASAIFHSQ